MFVNTNRERLEIIRGNTMSDREAEGGVRQREERDKERQEFSLREILKFCYNNFDSYRDLVENILLTSKRLGGIPQSTTSKIYITIFNKHFKIFYLFTKTN